jgi:16S rRNA (uracil1498-N3)-methyltransferase
MQPPIAAWSNNPTSVMHRFYLPPPECHSDLLVLNKCESHHALSVLRIRERERVQVLNGAGDEFLCEVQQADRRGVSLKVLKKSAIPALPFEVTLAQAVTKGKTMEWIVQKAAELGVHRIVPILSERTVARLEAHDAGSKVGKWQVTAIEAIKQCGSAWLPRIEAPQTPQSFLTRNEKLELSLIASLQDDALHPRKHFDSFLAEHQRRPKSVCVWVGPEGDFTPSEVNAVRASGALPITLGPLVLRSETASIYCLSIINYELQSPDRE